MLVIIFLYETDSHYTVQAGLELTSFPLLPEYWDHRHVPPCLGLVVIVALLFLSSRYLKTKYLKKKRMFSILWSIMDYIHFIQTSLSRIRDWTLETFAVRV